MTDVAVFTCSVGVVGRGGSRDGDERRTGGMENGMHDEASELGRRAKSVALVNMQQLADSCSTAA